MRNTRQRILDILWFRVINQHLDSITNVHDSTGRLHLAMRSIYGKTPRENQAISCLQDGVQFGSEADHTMPNSKDHIFWKLTSWLDCLLTLDLTDPAFRNEGLCLSSFANAHQRDRSGEYSHATLAMAAEVGAVNYIRRHPNLHAVVDECAATCECLPLFFYTLCHGTLLHIDWGRRGYLTPSWRRILSDRLIKELLLAGCDPNSFASEAEGIPMPSPWALWLKTRVSEKYLTREEKLATLGTLEVFLTAGVNPNHSYLPTSFNLVNWIEKELWDISLKEHTHTIIALSQQLTAKRVRGKRKSDQTMVRADQRDSKRICYC